MNNAAQKASERHPSISGDTERAIQLNFLCLDHYLHEETYSRVTQIADTNNSPRNIDEAHSSALVESFHNFNYNYARGVMTVYCSSKASPDGATYTSAVQSVDGRKSLKDSYCIIMVGGRHLFRSFEMLQDENVKECAPKLMRMRYAFGIVDKPILRAQTIKQSKIANITTMIVQQNLSFTIKKQNVLSYTLAFETDFDIRFFSLRVTDIVGDMRSS